VNFGRFGQTVPSASQMDWYDADGGSMDEDDWNSPSQRTLQYLVASTPEHEAFNRVLLIVHALEADVTVALPRHDGVSGYTLLWDSSHDDLRESVIEHAPGTPLLVAGTSMQLLRAH
jgi:glycogen debranching enzyme